MPEKLLNDRALRNAEPRRASIRNLYKPEPERKTWRSHEQGLLNLQRKLTPEQRLLVYLFAERLALENINTLLERDRARALAGRIAKREIKRVAGRHG